MTSVTTDRRFGVNVNRAVKVPCKTASTGNLTLSGEQTIDGVSCTEDDRVLAKNQTDTTENGIYVVSSGTWTRSPDWNDKYDVTQGTLIHINQGTSNATTIWRVTTSGTITPGTTSVAFSLMGLAGSSSTSDLIAYDPGWTGSTPRTVEGRLQEKVSLWDFDVDPTLSNDSTSGFAAAAALGDNYTIIIPKGRYAVTSTIAQTGQSFYWLGEGGINSEIYFDPTGTDVLFYVHNNGSVYFRGGFKNIFFNGADTTQQKTAILLEDTSQFIIHDCDAHGNSFNTGWSDAGFDSIWLHTKGREGLSVRGCNIVADIPIQMDLNPNTLRTQTLDADHYNFHDMNLLVPSGADTPCVRVKDGVNLTDVSFTGYQPWVRPGGHAFEWIDTTNNNVASLNLVFDGVGPEQAQDATKYNFYISKTGTNSLSGVQFNNIAVDGTMNGFYFRNTKRVSLTNGYMPAAAAKVAVNADATCDDIGWSNFDWGSGNTDSIAGLERISGLKKVNTAEPYPMTAHYVVSESNTYAQEGAKLFSANQWAYAGTIAHSSEYQLPASQISGMDVALVTAYAYSSTGGVSLGGTFGINGGGTVAISRNSTLFSTATSTGELSLIVSGSITRLHNETGHTLEVIIKSDYKV